MTVLNNFRGQNSGYLKGRILCNMMRHFPFHFHLDERYNLTNMYTFVREKSQIKKDCKFKELTKELPTSVNILTNILQQ